MDGHPPVSCFCPTYGRPSLLEEAIESFLRQDYSGESELVVLNDLDRQLLVFEHPRVRIVNLSRRFATLGDKRNACIEMARFDLLCPWDDDDIYLPNRLSYSVRQLDAAQGYFKPASAFFFNDGRIDGIETNMFHAQALFTRKLFERVGRYASDRNGGDDLVFEKAFSELSNRPTLIGAPIEPVDIYYVYRWAGTASYHLSWFGDAEATGPEPADPVQTLVLGAIEKGELPEGRIVLEPRWIRNYTRLAADHLRSLHVKGNKPSTSSSAIERLSIAELERRLRAEASRVADQPDSENTRFFSFAAKEVMPSQAEQRQLLRAAALRGQAALDAWHGLESAAVPLGRLHPSLWGLLPPLYANLRRLGVETESTARFKMPYLQALTRNRLLLAAARSTLEALASSGVDCLVLQGAALLPLYHQDWGSRVMTHLALWVRETDLSRAAQVLAAQRWASWDGFGRATLLPPSTRFRSDAGDLDLHWKLMLPCCRPGMDAELWDRAVPMTLEGTSAYALCPTDQLFEILGDAEMSRAYSGDSSAVWAIDAMAVLHEAADKIDWARLSRLAEASELILSVERRLTHLREELDAQIPQAALDELDRCLPTFVERLEASIAQRQDPRERRLLGVLSRFLRLRRHPRYRSLVRGPLHFLRDLWRLDQTSQVPSALVRRALYHARALSGSRSQLT